MNVSLTNLELKRNDGLWPLARHGILDWLVTETRTERYIDNIFVEFCNRVTQAGIPLEEANLQLRTCHPEWLGANITWKIGVNEALIDTFAYGIEATDEFQLSAANELKSGAKEVRQRLDMPAIERPWPSLKRLAERGFTDFVAWPINHTLEQSHVVTFATSAKGGFLYEDLAFLRDLIPLLALVSEIRLKNIISRTLLQTYVGYCAGAQILAGATTRGSGETISAAILICDMRDFTQISDLWPRDEVIEMLNAFFDAISEPIERNGGEILKFLGDGLLAVFPLEYGDACCKLLASIKDARRNMNELNAKLRGAGKPQLNYGVGVHLGDVMYGNIGTKKRLDFTVVGPAVNITSRLETLTKELGKSVLVSGAFADAVCCSDELERIGLFPIKGLEEPLEVFALKD